MTKSSPVCGCLHDPAGPLRRRLPGPAGPVGPCAGAGGRPGGSKRWPARIFHPRLRAHPVPKWRNGAIPCARGSRRAPGSHAPTTFFEPRRRPRAATAGLPEAPTVLRPSSTASRPRSGWPLARIPAGAAAPGRPLRLFSSATPLRPPLYEKKGRSGGWKSEVEGKGRSRRDPAGRVPRHGGGSRGTRPRRNSRLEVGRARWEGRYRCARPVLEQA